MDRAGGNIHARAGAGFYGWLTTSPVHEHGARENVDPHGEIVTMEWRRGKRPWCTVTGQRSSRAISASTSVLVVK